VIRIEQLIQEVSQNPTRRLIAEAVDLVVSIAMTPQGPVIPLVISQTATKQTLDDVGGFRKSLVTLAFARPARTDDVFVQAFSRAKPEGKSVVAEECQGGRTLSNDSRMVAHDGTGHCCHQSDALGCVCQRSKDRPGEWPCSSSHGKK
jgi:hypothetical protein